MVHDVDGQACIDSGEQELRVAGSRGFKHALGKIYRLLRKFGLSILEFC